MLSFQSPKSIQKEEHNSQRIKVQDGSAQASRESSKSREYRRVLVGTQAGYRRNSTFSAESYQSDGRTSSVAAEPRAGNASRHTRYLPEETV